MFSCDDANLPEFLASSFTFWAQSDPVGGGVPSPVKRIPTGRAFLVHTSRLAAAPTPLAAMAHLVPDARPFAPPFHRPPTGGADLDRQIGFPGGPRHLRDPNSTAPTLPWAWPVLGVCGWHGGSRSAPSWHPRDVRADSPRPPRAQLVLPLPDRQSVPDRRAPRASPPPATSTGVADTHPARQPVLATNAA